MKVLIIDNGSIYTKKIIKLVDMRHSYSVITYDPKQSISDYGHDAIVLSGSFERNVEDRLDDGSLYFQREIDFINTAEKPMMGICLGHQMVNVAFGGTLTQLDEKIELDEMALRLEKSAVPIFGSPEIVVHERHQWVVDTVPEQLSVMARSSHGVEMMQHDTRPVITTQFHPEYDTSEDSIFWDVFSATIRDDSYAYSERDDSCEIALGFSEGSLTPNM